MALIAQGPAGQTSTQIQDVFGSVSPPPGVEKFAGGEAAGLIIFISNLIKVVTIVAGIIGLFNVIAAGYGYLQSSGNPKAAEEAMNKMTMSLIGLIIIVGSFAIVAIASLLLFGDAGFILNPKIPTAGP